MDKKSRKAARENPVQPVVPPTEPADGAYLDTLKQLQDEREKADRV
ncbi:hypothetical protein [Sporomusa termitida]|nr:hypothetical protein [Sporomusa termitida]